VDATQEPHNAASEILRLTGLAADDTGVAGPT
jgi:hypothetical protein